MRTSNRSRAATFTLLAATLVFLAFLSSSSAQAKSLSVYTNISLPGETICKTIPGTLACANWGSSGGGFPTAECGGTKAWALRRRGKVRSTVMCDGGGPNVEKTAGQKFRWSGVSCTVLSNGVRCKNKSRHGFRITSESRSRF